MEPSLFIEEIYPYVIASITSIIAILVIVFDIDIIDNVDSILNAVISFTSILIGFIGALFALLFSLENNPIVKHIFKDTHYSKLIKKYFSSSISSGFLAIMFTLVLFFRATLYSIIDSTFSIYILDIIKVIWVFINTLFALQSYRVIHIIIKIAFRPYEKEEALGEGAATDESIKDQIDQMNKDIEI